MKILLVGFSVIEQKQGISQAIKELETSTSNDISFDFCGMGGHHIQTVAYLASDIFMRDAYDVVLLDLTSSSIRSSFQNPVVSQKFKQYLNFVLRYIQSLGMMAGLIHFYRKDVDYNNDILVQQCSVVAEKFGVPTLNLGKMIHETYSDEQIDLLFKDVVHTTSDGSQLYAEKILEFVEKCFCDHTSVHRQNAHLSTTELDKTNTAILKPEFLALSVRDKLMDSAFEFVSLERHKLVFEYVCIGEGQSITIDLDSDYQLDGIMAVIGPRSGTIEITSDSGDRSTVVAYDKYAYYERIGDFSCKNLRGRITLKQLPGVPTIELLKGEKNTENRIGKISYLNLSRFSKN